MVQLRDSEATMGEAKRRRLAAQATGVPLEPKTVKFLRSVARKLPPALVESLEPGLLPTTPTEPLSDQVRALCTRVSPDSVPIFMSFTDTGDYNAGQCHMNVLHRVRAHGGQRVNGWMIWECAMFAKAEFHCVWRSTEGQLIDITPRRDGEAMILFLPDPKLRLTRGSRGGVHAAGQPNHSGVDALHCRGNAPSS